MILHRFAPPGLLALDPKAFGAGFPAVGSGPVASTTPDAAVVIVRGPLMHHENFCFDSYDSIRSRVAMALDSPAPCVVLSIDSPGGLVSGCFDTVREIREMAEISGKPLYAFIDGDALSSGYALACAASKIFISDAGQAGSCGVYEMRGDFTAADQQMGLKFTIISSGARKADGNPHTELTDGELAESQASVNGTAALFYDLVASARGKSADEIQSFDARTFRGSQAVARGLADQVSTFSEMLAAVASGAINMNDDDKARSALQAIADDDKADEKARARARKALKAMSDDSDDEEKKEEPKKEEAKAEGDSEKKDEPKDDDDGKAMALKALAQVHTLQAERDAEKLALERKELLASRPDFSTEMVAALNKAPIATVKEMVRTLPRGAAKSPVQAAMAATTVSGTRGEGQVGDEPSSTSESELLKAQMGLATANVGPHMVGTKMILPAMTPAQSRAYSEKQARQAASQKAVV